jgi:hypothetical protein
MMIIGDLVQIISHSSVNYLKTARVLENCWPLARIKVKLEPTEGHPVKTVLFFAPESLKVVNENNTTEKKKEKDNMINVGDEVQIVSPRAISNGNFGKVEAVDDRYTNPKRYYLVRQLGDGAMWFSEDSLMKVNNPQAEKIEFGDYVKITSLNSVNLGKIGIFEAVSPIGKKAMIRVFSSFPPREGDNGEVIYLNFDSIEKIEDSSDESINQTVTLERNDTNTFDSDNVFVMVEGFNSVFIRDKENHDELLTVIYASPNDNKPFYTGAILDIIDDLDGGQMVPFKGKIVIEQ